MTQLNLQTSAGRAFDAASVAATTIEALIIPIVDRSARLPPPFPAGYYLHSQVWTGRDGRICAGAVQLVKGDDSRPLAFISVALDHEPCQVLWEEHVAMVTNLGGQLPPDGDQDHLEFGWMQSPPWLLATPILAMPEECNWLDDFARAWAAALKTVSDETVTDETTTAPP